MTDESAALDAVHDPAPSTPDGQPSPVDKCDECSEDGKTWVCKLHRADTNPRRHWRVTKAQLLGRIAELEAMCEQRAAEVGEWMNATVCASIDHANAKRDCESYEAALDAWRRTEVEKNALIVYWRNVAMFGFAGWLASAVAVVW